MLKIRIIGAVCLCCILFAALAFGEAVSKHNLYENAITIARSEIWQAINSGKCGSATTAIMVDGNVVYAEGFGMANREKSIPVVAATLFNIGSISKVYVATAIMLLVDDGKVSLDRPVTDYLPEFRMADDRYRKITVRMLLNHVSGMPGTEGSNSFGFKYDDNIKQETINTLARAHLKHAPGAMAVYCNDGFTLAEMIVERVSGKKYINFLNERIFKPLGLKNTGTGVGEIKGKPVALYYDAKTGKRHPLETLSILGAGGLSSTAEELCRFTDAFSAGNKILKKASLEEMKKAQPSAFWGKLRNPEISFGLG
jgi:CubicO group peptidase (beta-lactamase class C family)